MVMPKKKGKKESEESDEEKPEIDIRLMTNMIYSANFDYN